VKTGLSDGINIEILSGIAKEDKIKGNPIDPKKKPEEKK
jgi:HlyD family secretion protein